MSYDRHNNTWCGYGVKKYGASQTNLGHVYWLAPTDENPTHKLALLLLSFFFLIKLLLVLLRSLLEICSENEENVNSEGKLLKRKCARYFNIEENCCLILVVVKMTTSEKKMTKQNYWDSQLVHGQIKHILVMTHETLGKQILY